MVLGVVIRAVAFAVFGTIFIVRWHRFVLIGETASDGLFPPGWGLFFIAAIKITLGVIVGMVILMLIAWTWDNSAQRSAAEASQDEDGELPGGPPERRGPPAERRRR